MTLIESDNQWDRMITAFTGVTATMNNIGPGLGQVGLVDNYVHLHPLIKWIFSFLMLVGRLEIFSVIILFVPAGWRKGA